MKFNIGDTVYYVTGYRGYHAATVVDYEYGHALRCIIEFSSGLQLSVYEDELEEA